MNDTSRSAIEKMREMMLQKTPQERLAMGCSMHASSKRLLEDSIEREHPRLSKSESRREFFKRMYGTDFNPIQREKIAEYLIAFKEA